MPTSVHNEYQAFLLALHELDRARSLYPQWYTDAVYAAATASEESGEVVKAVNDLINHGKGSWEEIRTEAIQAVAMWVRFLVETPGVNGQTDSSNVRVDINRGAIG